MGAWSVTGSAVDEVKGMRRRDAAALHATGLSRARSPGRGSGGREELAFNVVAAECEVGGCGVLARSRCERCGRAYCEGHGAGLALCKQCWLRSLPACGTCSAPADSGSNCTHCTKPQCSEHAGATKVLTTYTFTGEPARIERICTACQLALEEEAAASARYEAEAPERVLEVLDRLVRSGAPAVRRAVQQTSTERRWFRDVSTTWVEKREPAYPVGKVLWESVTTDYWGRKSATLSTTSACEGGVTPSGAVVRLEDRWRWTFEKTVPSPPHKPQRLQSNGCRATTAQICRALEEYARHHGVELGA
jgi:hypothetical protein